MRAEASVRTPSRAPRRLRAVEEKARASERALHGPVDGAAHDRLEHGARERATVATVAAVTPTERAFVGSASVCAIVRLDRLVIQPDFDARRDFPAERRPEAAVAEALHRRDAVLERAHFSQKERALVLGARLAEPRDGNASLEFGFAFPRRGEVAAQRGDEVVHVPVAASRLGAFRARRERVVVASFTKTKEPPT